RSKRDWSSDVCSSDLGIVIFIADENDDPGPIFEWLVCGDVPLDDDGVMHVSQASFDYVRPYWDQIGVTIAGRHVFDLTKGWDGKIGRASCREGGEARV